METWRQEELYHHGILGMKWGVRRYQNEDGSLTALGKKHIGQDDGPDKPKENEKQKGSAVNTASYKKKDVKNLSDEEINERIRRLDLERKYKQMLPDERSKGKAFVQDILSPALKKGATRYLDKAIGNVADNLGDRTSKKIKDFLDTKLGSDKKKEDTSSYKLEDISNLTTEELAARNKRLQQEKLYKGHFGTEETQTPKKQEQPKTESKSEAESKTSEKETKTVKEETRHEETQTPKKQEQPKTESKSEAESKTTPHDDLDKAKTLAPSRHEETINSMISRVSTQKQRDAAANARQAKRAKQIARNFYESRYDEDLWEQLKHAMSFFNELYHYGIPGMKWGVRKDQRVSSISGGGGVSSGVPNDLMDRKSGGGGAPIDEDQKQAFVDFLERLGYDTSKLTAEQMEYMMTAYLRKVDEMTDHDRRDYLAHHGIKGQKWGVRRFQNTDGTLTSEGKKRLGESYKPGQFNKAMRRNNQQATSNMYYSMLYGKRASKLDRKYEKSGKEKYREKSKQFKTLSKDYQKSFERGKKTADKITAEARKKGLTYKEHVGSYQVAIRNGREFSAYLRDNFGGYTYTQILYKEVRFKKPK